MLWEKNLIRYQANDGLWVVTVPQLRVCPLDAPAKTRLSLLETLMMQLQSLSCPFQRSYDNVKHVAVAVSVAIFKIKRSRPSAERSFTGHLLMFFVDLQPCLVA